MVFLTFYMWNDGNLTLKRRQGNLQWVQQCQMASSSNIMSISRLRSIEMWLTWIAATSAGGCCLCWTWRPPHSCKAANGSSSSVATLLPVPGCGDISRCAINDLRCRDDLISGSPDEQDWSLVSAGNEVNHHQQHWTHTDSTTVGPAHFSVASS